MKMLKRVVIGIVGLIVALFVFSLFLPSKWSLERSIVIDAPPAKIYPLVASVKNGWPPSASVSAKPWTFALAICATTPL